MEGHTGPRWRGLVACLASLVLLLTTGAWGAGADVGKAPGANAERATATQPEAGHLTFRGLSGQPLQLRSDSGELEYALIIMETHNARADKVRLVAPVLQDESGVDAYAVEVLGGNDKPLGDVSLEPLQSIPVKIRAHIPRSGTYHTTLTLLSNGVRQASVEVRVTRPRQALNVEVVGAPMTVSGTAVFAPDKSSAFIPLMLSETQGQPIALEPPRLVSLSLKGEGADLDMAPHTSEVFLASAETKLLDPTRPESERPVLLDRWQTLPFILKIPGLPGAGEYEGTVRLSSAEAPPLDATFTLDLKESFTVAFLCILVGVLFSQLLRFYLMSVRPRLLLKSQVLAFCESLTMLKHLNHLKHPLAFGPEFFNHLMVDAKSVCKALSLGNAVDAYLSMESTEERDRLAKDVGLLEWKLVRAWDWVELWQELLSERSDHLSELEKLDHELELKLLHAGSWAEVEGCWAWLRSELMQVDIDDSLKRVPRRKWTALFSEKATTLERHVAPSLRRAKDLREHGSMEAALREYEAARRMSKNMGLEMPPGMVESMQPLRTPPPPPRTAIKGHQVLIADLLSLILILAVATLVGMKLFWVDDSTWGGWGDRIMAFFWGLSLHLIGSAGLYALLENLLSQVSPKQSSTPKELPGT